MSFLLNIHLLLGQQVVLLKHGLLSRPCISYLLYAQNVAPQFPLHEAQAETNTQDNSIQPDEQHFLHERVCHLKTRRKG